MGIKLILIDGSTHEGGGAILRIATGLSALTEKPIEIFNIRVKRQNPGIQVQHLEAIKSVSKLCNAEMKGAELGSKTLEFHPGKISAKKIDINISTAGSTGLVLQGLMIPAAHAENLIEIHIKGGATAGKWAAPLNYIKYVFLEILKKLNYKAEIEIKKYGYYPKGGADVFVKIYPCKLKPLQSTEQGKLLNIRGISHASENLKNKNVAERMKESAEEILNKLMKPDIKIEYTKTICPGCGIELFANYENTILGSDGLGELKKSAEDVGKEAAEKLIKYHNSKAALDRHMADQILPYIALAEHGESKVSVAEITNHCLTNIWLIKKFLSVKFKIEGEKGKPGIISVKQL